MIIYASTFVLLCLGEENLFRDDRNMEKYEGIAETLWLTNLKILSYLSKNACKFRL